MGDTIDEIGGLAGGGGPNNSRFTASNANILQPTTVGQANTAYQSAQDALSQQQALAQALQSQGNQGMASQTQLAQALQQQAQGGGPNPALAQLNQATANNTANQAALMAGQRGASSNAGLIARQAAQTGAANQQNAAGQAATLQAQQQLAAQQQLQNLSANQIGQQSGALNTYNQAAQGEQGNILNSINAQNNAMVGMQSNINNANAGLAQTNANNSAKFTSGLLNSAGGAITGGGGGGFAHGGMVEDPLPNKKLAKVPVKDRMPLPDHIQGMADIYHPHYAFGGPVVASGPANDVGSPNAIANASQIGSGGGSKKSPTKDTPISTSENDVVGSSGASGGANLAGGAMDAGGGGLMGAVEANPELLLAASKGAFVPGKAKVKGDSPKNDTVDAKLSPGEIVIPRHILQSDDPVANSANFVKALLEKHGNMGQEEDDFKAALKTAIKSRGKK